MFSFRGWSICPSWKNFLPLEGNLWALSSPWSDHVHKIIAYWVAEGLQWLPTHLWPSCRVACWSFIPLRNEATALRSVGLPTASIRLRQSNSFLVRWHSVPTCHLGVFEMSNICMKICLVRYVCFAKFWFWRQCSVLQLCIYCILPSTSKVQRHYEVSFRHQRRLHY